VKLNIAEVAVTEYLAADTNVRLVLGYRTGGGDVEELLKFGFA